MAGNWNERFENAKEDLSKDVSKFLQLTEELEEIATKVTSKQRSELTNMKTKVDGILQIVNRGQMKVAFFGRTSNGKSTVINALLGTKVLPSACGSVSSCFCTIEGRHQVDDIIYRKGMAKVGKVQYDNLQSARSLASHLSQEHLGVNDVLEIYWPTQDCELLQANVVLVDSPGIGTEHSTDEQIEKNCKDADIFVYVCNGIATLEHLEMDFLLRVSRLLSKPTNLFILINHWDTVIRNHWNNPAEIDAVRNQHLTVASEFLTKKLKIADEKDAKEHVFIVSGQEALTIKEAPPEVAREDFSSRFRLEEKWEEREKEFMRFRDTLKESLTESAIQTKFGRHCEECQECVETVKEYCIVLEKDMHDKRKKINNEISALDKAIKDLRKGEGGLADEYGVMTDNLQKSVQKEVKQAVVTAKIAVKKEIDGNPIVNSKDTTNYVNELCEVLKSEIDDVTEDLHKRLNRMYGEFVNRMKEIFKKHMRRFPEVAESISGLPRLPDCASLAGDYAPSYRFHRHLMPGFSLKDASGLLGAGGLGTGVGVALATGPLAVPIAAGLGIFAGGYSVFKVTTWFVSDDWKRGINADVYNTLASKLEAHVGSLQKDCTSVFKECLKGAKECFSKEFQDAVNFKEEEMQHNREQLKELEELISNFKKPRSDLDDVKTQLECFKKQFLDKDSVDLAVCDETNLIDLMSNPYF